MTISKKKYQNHKDVKAILIHHLFGLVCRDYLDIINFAKENNIKVIEDCAHATGATFKGKPVGNYGDLAFYSSEQSKIINTFNGGVATTNNENLAKRIKEYQEHAPFPSEERTDKLIKNIILCFYRNKFKYNWVIGYWKTLWYRDSRLVSTTLEEEKHIRPQYYGQRMPAPLAAIGISQLEKLENYNNQRRGNAQKWDDWCSKNNLETPKVIPNSKPVYLRYPVLVTEDMKKNLSWASHLNVTIGKWFVSYLHPIPFEIKDCPKSLIAVKKLVNLPTLSL